MVETLKLKEEKMKKIKENAETRMAVYIVYCHLENKKRKLNSSKNKGRTMPAKQVIGLPLSAFVEKVKHNHRRGGP